MRQIKLSAITEALSRGAHAPLLARCAWGRTEMSQKAKVGIRSAVDRNPTDIAGRLGNALKNLGKQFSQGAGGDITATCRIRSLVLQRSSSRE